MRFKYVDRELKRQIKRAEKWEYLSNWHDHFLWWPTKVNDQTIWLETVQRQLWPAWDAAQQKHDYTRGWPRIRFIWNYRVKS